ncbi:hypothetical protein FQN55_005157, partial [Onygenales sp. PD_40]
LVQDKEAQVAHPAGDDDDEKENSEEEDNEGANPIQQQNKQVLYSNPTQLDKEGLSTGKLNAFHAAPSKQQDKPVDPEDIKIKKVLSHILKLNSILKDKEYNFCGHTLNILTKFMNKEHSLPNQGDSYQMDKDVCINA